MREILRADFETGSSSNELEAGAPDEGGLGAFFCTKAVFINDE